MVSLVLHARIVTPKGELTLEVRGREAWALAELVAAGKRGCTPIEYPAPRWSHYIFRLRGLGFDIETVRESHGGRFAGTHGRYVLHSDVRLTQVFPDDPEPHDCEAAHGQAAPTAIA